MDIKDKLVLNGMTWAAADNIEYNNIVIFQTSNSNTLGIILFDGQVMHIPYKKQYICHAFDLPVIITEGELVCPAKFMTPMRKILIGIVIQMNKSLSW